MKKLLSIISGFTAAFVLVAAPLASAAPTTTVVTPGNTDGWTFASENTAGGTGNYVSGPSTPPLGTGSAQFSLTASNQGYILAKQGFAGTKISSLTNLKYSTYVQSGNNTIAPALQFNIDPNVDDAKNLWYSRLVYEPYYNGAVVDGTWQTWDALEGGQAEWWLNWNTNATNDYGTNPCPQSNPCTVDELLTAFPDIGVRTDANAAVLFKVGSGWNVPFTGNVDKFEIQETTYDFEVLNAPTISSPANNAVVTPAALTEIDWNDVTTAVSYQYRSFTDASYTSQAYDSGFILVESRIPTPGTPVGTYYVQVRAMDSMGNMSAWSNDASNPYKIVVQNPTPPPVVVPTNIDQCKKDGWKSFTNPSFRNQGQCVSFVASNGRSVANINQLRF